MSAGKAPVRRCAVYTRKSSEEGLEQDFNSLHAQREACEAFVRSQKGEGWRLLDTAYDDGGLSGGTMERPALQRLLADIALRTVDVVVVYKVDRLTRSLADFAKMVELFDARGVSFVAVTQQFNTTSSMGRLTLNVLLSFAQFEREVTGERIRDKIAASKRKGLWMGGTVPLGYAARDRRLVVEPAEADTVRRIFRRYRDLGCVRRLKEELDREGIRPRPWRGAQAAGFSRGALYALLGNPVYIGETRHKGQCHPGQHEPIIDRALWEGVRRLMHGNAPDRAGRTRRTEASPLTGKLFDESGGRLTPSHAVKGGRRYRYYVSQALVTGEAGRHRGWRVPAQELERCVADAVRALLGDRHTLAGAAREAGIAADRLPLLLEAAGAFAGDPLDVAERIELGPDGLGLTVSLAGLVGTDLPAIRHVVPLEVTRRGAEMRLVINAPGQPVGSVDPALLKAVARARVWFDELAEGRTPSLAAIAAREGVSDRYVGHLLPLAFLAPDIVEAIVAGRQPPGLTAESLIKRTDLPLDWDRQREALGFT